jgi:adenosylhomocysteine nucleosidase
VRDRHISRRTLLLLAAACVSIWPLAGQERAIPASPEGPRSDAARPVVVLGIPAEVKDVEAQLERVTIERVRGVAFSIGAIGSTRVILGKTNAGKVNAAMMTALVVEHFAPSAVFFTGTAGAIDPELKPGDVVIGSSIGHHDFGMSTAGGFVRRPTVNPVTARPNPAFFLPDARLLSAARRLAPALRLVSAPGMTRTPVVRDGIIVTGDMFVANPTHRDEMRRTLMASAVEMEGAAVAQVCLQLGVPFIVIRSITDSADGGTPDDYRTNLEAASRNAAAVTLAVIADLARK